MLKFFIIFIFFVCKISNVNAQILNGCVFLKSDYLEVGIAPNGAFGTPNNAPLGYHPRPTPGPVLMYNPTDNSFASRLQAIGFVSDYTKDGWTVGTPAFMGDYFMPQTVQEGWSIEIDGVKRNAYSNSYQTNGNSGFSSGLSGNNIDYTTTASEEKSVWSGLASTLAIRQTIVLKKTKSYFTVSVSLKNTGIDTLKRIYYMRTVDPDNEASLTNVFSTKNKIDFQSPNPFNKTMVTATGTTYNAFLGLGTKACDSKCFYLSNGLTPLAGLAQTFNQVAPGYIYQDSAIGDVGIGIVFKIGNLPPGDSTAIAYAYILNKEDLDDAFVDIDQGFSFNGTNYLSGSTIIQPIGSILPIGISNASNYNWTWTPTTNLNVGTGSNVNATVGTSPIVYTVSGIRNATTTTTCNNRTLTITISPFPVSPLPTVITPVVYCKNQPTVPLIANGTGSILWYSTPTGGIGSSIAPTPSSAIPGEQFWYVSQILAGIESQRVPINVIINDLPTININPVAASICLGDTISLTATGSSIITQYTWTPSSILSATSGSIVKAYPSINSTITVSVKDTNNCISAKSAFIIVNPLPTFNYSPLNPVLCETDSVTLNISGTNTYFWSPTIGLSSNFGASVVAFPNVSTNYIVRGTDTNGCKSQVNIQVIVNPLPIPNLGPDKSICKDSIIVLNPGNFQSYLWQDGSLNPNFSAINLGLYWVLVKNNFGCKAIDSFRLKSFYLPPTNFLPDDRSICKGKMEIIKVGNYVEYLWSTGEKSSSIITNKIGKYYLTVKDQNGCIGKDSIELYKKDCIPFIIPNTFTPNKDGVNDIFRPIITETVTNYKFSIWNRWGLKIYTTENQFAGWNGFYNGQLQETGTYVYILEFLDSDNVPKKYKGTIILVR